MSDHVLNTTAVDSSYIFRTIMAAMSRPGRILAFQPPGTVHAPLLPGTAAMLLTLCDFQTPIYLIPELAGSAVTKYLRFHTGAPLTPNAADCSFAVLAAGLDMPRLADFPQGTHEYPDRSATLLIQVPQVSAGGHVALRGPGIESTVDVTVAGMGAGFWRELMRNRDGFPIGVDVVFISPDAICACPRSTTVMLRETA
jgi:alpha-D-ribose 1-methylphosphonate 5-triphosphate synthase subunit PhnH